MGARLGSTQSGKSGTVTIEGQERDVTQDLIISTGPTAYNLSAIIHLPVIMNAASANLNSGIKAIVRRLPFPISTVIPFALGTTEALTKLDQFLTSVAAYQVEGTAHGLDAGTVAAFRADCVAIIDLQALANSNFVDVDVVR